MASFFFWLVVSIVSLLLGAFIIFILWGLVALIKDLFLTWRIPKNKKALSEYLKQPEIKEKYCNPGKPTDSDKEVKKQDEQRRARKYREFERLRREEFKARIGESPKDNPGPTGGQQLQQQRGVFQNGPSREPKDNSPRNPKSKPRVSLYD